MKIFNRLLVVHGPTYFRKFVDKAGGLTIMQHRLRRWWNFTDIWLACFAILFGQDVTNVDFKKPFELFNLMETFTVRHEPQLVNPEILQIITAMLSNGLKTVARVQEDSESPSTARGDRLQSSIDQGPQHGATVGLQPPQPKLSSSSTGRYHI